MAKIDKFGHVINMKSPTLQSLCWTCQLAWPGKCQWITSQKHVWRKALKKELSGAGGKKYTAYIVQECEFYVPEEAGGKVVK